MSCKSLVGKSKVFVLCLQFKYKQRVYKQSQVNIRKMKHLHSKVCDLYCVFVFSDRYLLISQVYVCIPVTCYCYWNFRAVLVRCFRHAANESSLCLNHQRESMTAVCASVL